MIFDVKLLEQFPMHPGVYLMKDASNKIIYIGKANHLKIRIKQYFSFKGDGRPMVPFLVRQIAHIDTIVTPNEKEALLLENTLIKKHQPKFNAVLKDDKTFVSIMINQHHRWPMIRLVRTKGLPNKGDLYFGPYTNAYAARQTYELLTRLFPLRQCSDQELAKRKRPCLLYSIKRCIAPCVNKCSKEDYDALVANSIKFLKGQDKEILQMLYSEMKTASEGLEYERAAALLKIIRQIEQVIATQTLVVNMGGKDSDVLAIYRQAEEVMLVQLLFRQGQLVGSEHYPFSKILEEEGDLYTSFILQHYQITRAPPSEILIPIPLENALLISEILSERHQKKITLLCPQKGEKKALIGIAEENARALFHQEKDHQDVAEKMLLDLQETLKLNRYPKRIECLDTSNISGTDPVAALVAFTDAEKDTKRSRLFKIRSVPKGDDYGSMREVLRRHLKRVKEADDLPDLIIVDGGKGQLNVALQVFKELDIATVDLIALAKELARHDKGMTAESIFLVDHHDPIHLNPRSNLLFLLQKIRDEAHRKAISFHRDRRKKRTLISSVDSIPGIGPIKRNRLLRHFGSVEKILLASSEELLSIEGITKKDVSNLKNSFT